MAIILNIFRGYSALGHSLPDGNNFREWHFYIVELSNKDHSDGFIQGVAIQLKRGCSFVFNTAYIDC